MNKQRLIHGYIAMIFFVMFGYGISRQLIGTLITRIILHYDILMAQAGFLTSFVNIGNFAAIFILTIFAGRVNKIILLWGTLFLFSASLFLISTAPEFSVILASFALIGVFGATTDALVSSLIADFRPEKASLNISLLHGVFGLGGLSGPIVIERLARDLSWDEVHFVISMAFFVYLAVYAIFVKWQWSLLTTQTSPIKQKQFGLSDIARFFTRKRNVLLYVIMFLYAGNQTTLSVWVMRYVETHLNDAVWGAYALSAMWLGTALCRFFISPNIKASSPIKIGVGNLISAIVLTIGLLSNSVAGIVAASLLVGLSSGLTIPLVLALGCEWHQDKTAFGTMMPFTAFYFGSVIFPPLTGSISDHIGIPWGIAVAVVSSVLVALFSAVLELRLKSQKT